MRYFGGIDGGQSATIAVIGDEHGAVIGRGRAGPCDEVGQAADSARLRDALSAALADAVAHAGLPPDAQFERVVAGVSGYDGRVYGAAPRLPAQTLALIHDAPAAHAGAFEGEPGIVVIAGTGSVAYGFGEDRRAVTVGGWGYLFGDEGSAFWLARTAITEAMSDLDAGRANELTGVALQFFGMPSMRALARAFYTQNISRTQIAAFAGTVVHAAERGDDRAAGYVSRGAITLATLAAHCSERLAGAVRNVAFVGGMLRNLTVEKAIIQALPGAFAGAHLVLPRYGAAEGALLLAYQASGIRPGALSRTAP